MFRRVVNKLEKQERESVLEIEMDDEESK